MTMGSDKKVFLSEIVELANRYLADSDNDLKEARNMLSSFVTNLLIKNDSYVGIYSLDPTDSSRKRICYPRHIKK